MTPTLTIVQPDLSLDTKEGYCVQVAMATAAVGVGWGGLSGFPPVVLPHALLDIGTPAYPSPSLYWFKIRISAKVDDAA